MKVILLEDVKSLGKKGQLVDVSDGYARNFILAKKLGLEATSKNMNDLKLQKAHEDKLAAERLAEAKAFAEDLKKVEVTLSIKTGEGGKLFGSISSKEIAQAAKEQLNLDIDKKKLVLPESDQSCRNDAGTDQTASTGDRRTESCSQRSIGEQISWRKR